MRIYASRGFITSSQIVVLLCIYTHRLHFACLPLSLFPSLAAFSLSSASLYLSFFPPPHKLSFSLVSLETLLPSLALPPFSTSCSLSLFNWTHVPLIEIPLQIQIFFGIWRHCCFHRFVSTIFLECLEVLFLVSFGVISNYFEQKPIPIDPANLQSILKLFLVPNHVIFVLRMQASQFFFSRWSAIVKTSCMRFDARQNSVEYI